MWSCVVMRGYLGLHWLVFKNMSSPLPSCQNITCSSDDKESACNMGDLGSIPGLGRSPEGRHGNPLQYSCLESPHGQWSLVGYSLNRVGKSQTQLKRLSMHIQTVLTRFRTLGFPGGSDGKESAHNAGDLGLIPGLGRAPGEGNSYPLQYSCLENFMARGAW